MTITSSDILNLSHALKDICEVNCNTPECLSQTLKIMLQYNLIQANLQYMRANENSCCLQDAANGRSCDTLQKTMEHAHTHRLKTEYPGISGEHGSAALREIAMEHIHDHDRQPAEDGALPASPHSPGCE